MPDQTADLQFRKAVEIGPHSRGLLLDFRIHRRRILGLVDDIGKRCEYEARRISKDFVFELPDAIHENVRRAECSPNQATRTTIALVFDRFPNVTDDHAIDRAVQPSKASMMRCLLYGRLQQMAIQPELIASFQSLTSIAGRLKKCICFGIVGIQGGEEWLAMQGMMTLRLPLDFRRVHPDGVMHWTKSALHHQSSPPMAVDREKLRIEDLRPGFHSVGSMDLNGLVIA